MDELAGPDVKLVAKADEPRLQTRLKPANAERATDYVVMLEGQACFALEILADVSRRARAVAQRPTGRR